MIILEIFFFELSSAGSLALDLVEFGDAMGGVFRSFRRFVFGRSGAAGVNGGLGFPTEERERRSEERERGGEEEGFAEVERGRRREAGRRERRGGEREKRLKGHWGKRERKKMKIREIGRAHV